MAPRLNMVAAESAAARAAVTELAARPPETILSLFERVPTLFMPARHPVSLADVDPRQLQKVLLKTYERAPERFETVLATEGLGPKALRALVLTAELIYGTKASARDPARFSFAHGGKDGTPYRGRPRHLRWHHRGPAQCAGSGAERSIAPSASGRSSGLPPSPARQGRTQIARRGLAARRDRPIPPDGSDRGRPWR